MTPVAGTAGAVSVRRAENDVEALLERTGLHRHKDAEAKEVADLLLHKLAHDVGGNGDVAADTLTVRGAFLSYRFITPVTAFERGERFYGCLDTILNLTSIAAGIGASLAAALGAAKALTIVLGVIIAGCQTFSQWLKPAQRASRRAQSASELRSEAWNLLQGRDRYRDKLPDQAWNIFCDQVDKVEEREELAQDKESSPPPPGGGKSRSQSS